MTPEEEAARVVFEQEQRDKLKRLKEKQDGGVVLPGSIPHPPLDEETSTTD